MPTVSSEPQCSDCLELQHALDSLTMENKALNDNCASLKEVVQNHEKRIRELVAEVARLVQQPLIIPPQSNQQVPPQPQHRRDMLRRLRLAENQRAISERLEMEANNAEEREEQDMQEAIRRAQLELRAGQDGARQYFLQQRQREMEARREREQLRAREDFEQEAMRREMEEALHQSQAAMREAQESAQRAQEEQRAMEAAMRAEEENLRRAREFERQAPVGVPPPLPVRPSLNEEQLVNHTI
ncbi:hypothetical protein PCE1_002252 [Barthelona sp. PCE]